jgi:hypothetical protein
LTSGCLVNDRKGKINTNRKFHSNTFEYSAPGHWQYAWNYGLALRRPVPLPNLDVDTWVQVVTGSSYFLAQILSIFAYILPYFGFWVLYAHLARIKQVERIAF